MKHRKKKFPPTLDARTKAGATMRATLGARNFAATKARFLKGGPKTIPPGLGPVAFVGGRAEVFKIATAIYGKATPGVQSLNDAYQLACAGNWKGAIEVAANAIADMSRAIQTPEDVRHKFAADIMSTLPQQSTAIWHAAATADASVTLCGLSKEGHNLVTGQRFRDLASGDRTGDYCKLCKRLLFATMTTLPKRRQVSPANFKRHTRKVVDA